MNHNTHDGKISYDCIEKLSATEIGIAKLMYKQNLYLVTNEGSDYKCWLQSANGNKIKNVRKDTANNLFKKGVISYSESITKKLSGRTHCYYLSEDFIKKAKYLNYL